MYYTNENTDLYETSNITPEGANTNNETISVVRAKANSNAQEIKGMVKDGTLYFVNGTCGRKRYYLFIFSWC